MLLGDWLQRRSMLAPGKIALVDAAHGNRPITYRKDQFG
jgi:hypothetical protein